MGFFPGGIAPPGPPAFGPPRAIKPGAGARIGGAAGCAPGLLGAGFACWRACIICRYIESGSWLWGCCGPCIGGIIGGIAGAALAPEGIWGAALGMGACILPPC